MEVIRKIKTSPLIETVKLPDELDISAISQNIVATSAEFKDCLKRAKKVANCNSNIFILGESGTGKEIIANVIHKNGPTKNFPFLAVNCSAIPENLLESEFFGYSKGAFTGAVESRAGLFEAAGRGTLFLDEIGDLNTVLQAKLLRLVQEKKVKRIGENHYRQIHCRILSASHKNLADLVRQKQFREDLYYRLNVIEIFIPPLRKRKSDILPLASFFLKKHASINNRLVSGFSDEAAQALIKNDWPGNVRQLENVIERAVVLEDGPLLELLDLKQTISPPTIEECLQNTLSPLSFSEDNLVSVDTLIKYYIQHVLKLNNGSKDKTAKVLEIDRKTLYRKMREMYNNKIYDRELMS